MTTKIMGILILNIPQAVLILYMSLYLINKTVKIRDVLLFSAIIGIYSYFVRPLLESVFVYTFITSFFIVFIMKFTCRVNLVEAFIAICASVAIYLNIENLVVFAVNQIAVVTAGDYTHFSWFKVAVLYTVIPIFCIMMYFIKKYKIHINIKPDSESAGGHRE